MTEDAAMATHSQQVRLVEKSVIIHKDENGFGLRIKGQAPVFIEHVHENGAAWRAGVRALDTLCKVNGVLVAAMDHKEVVLLFKSCSRFVALTLMSPATLAAPASSESGTCAFVPLAAGPALSSPLHGARHGSFSGAAAAASTSYSQKVYHFLNARPTAPAGADQLGGTPASHLGNRRLSGATVVGAAPPAPTLMDRTNSCRVSGLGAAQMGLGATRVGAHLQQQQQEQGGKLSRQDSVEERDKRLAVCICCRSSIGGGGAQGAQEPGKQVASLACAQCQARHKPRVLTKQQQQQGGSLRDAGPRLVRGAPLAGKLQQQQQLQSTSRGPTAAFSASIKSLPAAAAGPPGGKISTATNKPPQQQQQQQQVNKRLEIIREFIDTERTHTERLRCLNELFYRPLKEAGLVGSEQLRAVFSSHRTLYKIHTQIYRILMSCTSATASGGLHYADTMGLGVYSDLPLVGSALLEIFEGDLKRRLERASCTFCSAQATNTELLNKLTRRDTKSGELLAQITAQRMVGRLGIKDLLASCFQRLTKYPLLLGNLLKATPESLPLDEDEDDEELGKATRVGGHRRRSRSGLSAVQRRARMRAVGLSDDAGELDQELDEEEDEDEDEEDGEFYGEDESGDREGEGEEGREDTETETETDEDEEARRVRVGQAAEARRNTRRIMAIGLAEEREFIERALAQSRAILVRVNDSIRVAIARQRLKEIWKRTDKYPGVPLIDITKQSVVHEGPLTLRFSSKRSFDVYVLLLNNYLIILTREGQDKYRLKFFTPEGKSAVNGGGGGGGGSSSASAVAGVSSGSQASLLSNALGGGGNQTLAAFPPPVAGQQPLGVPVVYSPVFVIDEHLTTRDAATDENGFYLLCKRKDDSRIYEFASRSPAERAKWRDTIQWTIERQMGRAAAHRRPSCESTITKSSSEISANGVSGTGSAAAAAAAASSAGANSRPTSGATTIANKQQAKTPSSRPGTPASEPTKIVGTISYVIDDGIVLPSKMESSRVFVDQAIQVNILEGTSSSGGGSGGGGGATLRQSGALQSAAQVVGAHPAATAAAAL